MTEKEQAVYNAINKHYKEKGITVTDIFYSFIRDMYLIEYLEIYKGKGGANKVRIARKDITIEEVERMIKRWN